MIDELALALAVLSLGAGLSVAVQTVRRTFGWSRVAPTLVLLEVGLLVQAALDVAGLARGHQPREMPTHLAYLIVSVALVPIAAIQTRGDDGLWAGLLLTISLIVLAVLVIRLQTTWRVASG